MLRHFYRCALRLHPPGFRTRFAGEMLSIFDDAGGRAAEFRLMLDALLSLARQWALRPEFWHELSPVPAEQPTPDGIPSFYIIDPFRPRAAAVIHGLVLSTAVFCMTCFAIRYSWIHILHVRIPEVQRDEPQSTSRIAGSAADATSKNPGTSPRSEDRTPPAPSAGPHPSFNTQLHAAPTATANQNLTAQSPATLSPETQASETLGSKSHKGLRRFPGVVSREHAPQTPLQSPAGAYLDQPQAQPPTLQNATGVTSRAAVAGVALDAAERKRVIDGAIANLNKYYVDPEVARKMGDALIAHEKAGDDDAAADGAAFANLLTSQMRDVSHDQYVMMVYSAMTTPENPPAPTQEDVTRYRREMKERNCTFEKVTILPHNIAYLKFNGFPDASICRETVTAAMASVNHADAIIFDLRDNPGGYSNMVALIATYLFDHPTHLNDFYDRGENSTEESWTLPPVPGNRLADKPAFVLTSHSTFSAAEGFSYDLKMLKRATLVGETTSGRGHMGMGHRIDDHFTIHVPGIRVVNPISKTNWEGTGVEPDVQVKAADALEAARKLAETKLQKK
jgi:retinol-binding protein 3